MALPVLTLDEAAFAHNVEQIFQYARSHGAALAPHAKTPMSPQIVQRLLDAGAWGATVANLQQAAVLLRAGVTRLMLGNEIGGAASGARLGKLLAGYPHARLLAFADSADTVRSLAAAAAEAGRPVEVLVEVGGGRAGARDDAAVAAILAAIREQGDKLALAGVATYEGAVASSDADGARRLRVHGSARAGAARASGVHRGRLGLLRPCHSGCQGLAVRGRQCPAGAAQRRHLLP
jgi:D-serine dehydratase